MKRAHDVVELVDQNLVMRFGLTGVMQSMCVLKIGNYCRLYREGLELRARFTDRDDVIIEKFPNETLAENALGVASEALRGQVAEKPARKSRWKRFLPWIVAPILVLALLEALYFYTLSDNNESSAQSIPLMPYAEQQASGLDPLLPVLGPVEQTANHMQREPVLVPAKFAQLLGEAATKGYAVPFAVHDGQGAAETLYVFSDPNCIYCRRFDAQLEVLGKKYTVHLFPVSVVGEEASLRIGEQVLCLPPEERTAWWQKALQGVEMPSLPTASSCKEAVEDNNQAFRAMQFRGTPTILNGLGEEVPERVPHTAEALDAWMMSARKR